MESVTPTWLKRATMVIGTILVIFGLPIAINLLCLVPILLISSSDIETIRYGVISLTLTLLTLGVGIAAYWHSYRSLKNASSKPMHLPSAMVMVAAFIFLLPLGLILQAGDAGFLFVPILVASAALPPLWALAWMIPSTRVQPAEDEFHETTEGQTSTKSSSSVLTWRRAVLLLSAGATLSVLIALILEIALPAMILSLVSGLYDSMAANVRVVAQALSNNRVATAITSPGFFWIFVQIAVIAPIVEELAKPLAALPLLRNISRQEAFWLGALTGAGFAVLENLIYSTAGIPIWAGILAVRALGGALHPLCSGWVAMGWRDVMNRETNAPSTWWRYFGLAVAVHAIWNGGSLLVITLGSAGFFGELPPELDLLGVSAAGTVLAFLLLLGIGALWMGQSLGHNTSSLHPNTTRVDSEPALSDRAIAIWALVCLAAILPIGIVGLKLWLP